MVNAHGELPLDDALRDLKQQFAVDQATLEAVVAAFLGEMREGLQKEGHPVAMIVRIVQIYNRRLHNFMLIFVIATISRHSSRYVRIHTLRDHSG